MRLNTEMSSKYLRCLANDVVPINNNLLLESLGCFFIKTNKVYRIVLLNLGP